MATEKKGCSLSEAVMRSAQKEADAIKREIDLAAEKAYASFAAQARRESERRLQRKIAQNASALAARSGGEIGELRRRLFIRREALTAEVFDAVRARLAAFTASKEYPLLLEKLLDGAAQRLCGTPVRLFFRPADRQIVPALAARCPGAEILYSEEIELGGLIAEGGGMRIDCTLDARLADSREKFVRTCGLEVI